MSVDNMHVPAGKPTLVAAAAGTRSTLPIVAPVYNAQALIGDFVGRLTAVTEKLAGHFDVDIVLPMTAAARAPSRS